MIRRSVFGAKSRTANHNRFIFLREPGLSPSARLFLNIQARSIMFLRGVRRRGRGDAAAEESQEEESDPSHPRLHWLITS